ncbi:hypothetical protein [Paraburkholderia sp. BCC1884]|uniref:hypothetical protein n=1 Tax=Paraburkholderia sp. BCC1884 TaxID=2562668 RepID=UPI001183F722|nr:hypothetical protein [Paraburkholderia sp. BCC1884]
MTYEFARPVCGKSIAPRGNFFALSTYSAEPASVQKIGIRKRDARMHALPDSNVIMPHLFALPTFGSSHVWARL